MKILAAVVGFSACSCVLGMLVGAMIGVGEDSCHGIDREKPPFA